MGLPQVLLVRVYSSIVQREAALRVYAGVTARTERATFGSDCDERMNFTATTAGEQSAIWGVPPILNSLPLSSELTGSPPD